MKRRKKVLTAQSCTDNVSAVLRIAPAGTKPSGLFDVQREDARARAAEFIRGRLSSGKPRGNNMTEARVEPELVSLTTACRRIGIGQQTAQALSDLGGFVKIVQLRPGGRRYVLKREFDRWWQAKLAAASTSTSERQLVDA
jgi:hypothetical protein